MMRFDILTIFPEFFAGPFSHGVLSRARKQGLVELVSHDLRAFTHDRHRTVDDRPFGGGEGMVMKPEPILECFATVGVAAKSERDGGRESVVMLSAQGKPFTQAVAAEFAQLERVVFLCGRYEGIDERVNELLCDREVSIGDYILSGGELAAAVMIDAVVRLLPGVLGNRIPRSLRVLARKTGEQSTLRGMFRPRLMGRAACSIIPTTRGLRCSVGWKFLKCCRVEIIVRSGGGGVNGRSKRPCGTDRSFWRRQF